MGRRIMKTPPTYTSPFSSREEILRLVREYLEGDTKSPITEDKCLHAGRALLDGVPAKRSNMSASSDEAVDRYWTDGNNGAFLFPDTAGEAIFSTSGLDRPAIWEMSVEGNLA